MSSRGSSSVNGKSNSKSRERHESRSSSHRNNDSDCDGRSRNSVGNRRRDRSYDRGHSHSHDHSRSQNRHRSSRDYDRKYSSDLRRRPKREESADNRKQVIKEQPNFELSGKLTEETNTFRGVVIKYSEPPEAKIPTKRWRLYPFKGEKMLPVMYVHRQSAYLIGRERKVVDFPIDHPSCSKQHAVLQYRAVLFERSDGSTGKRVRPYLIDLESANGTSINGVKIEPKRYYELFEKDIIKFGFSTREYVLLQEESKDDDGNGDDEVSSENEMKHDSPPH